MKKRLDDLLDELEEFAEMLESDRLASSGHLSDYLTNITKDLKEMKEKYEPFRDIDYETKFACDSCDTLILKEETIFTNLSTGGEAYLCKICGVSEGFSIERLGQRE